MREYPFTIGIPVARFLPPDALPPESAAAELVVIQGIIDAYFEEDGELVLVDYKTDKTRSSRILLEHYKRQLDYYERALSQMTGKKVREKWIYSLTLQRAIPC